MHMVYMAFQRQNLYLILPADLGYRFFEAVSQTIDEEYFPSIARAKYEVIVQHRNCCAGMFVLVFYISKQRSIDSKRFD